MNYLLKSLLQFTLVALLGLIMLIFWCYGVKYYFDEQVKTEIKIRNIK
jgi:hypothetical protein